MSVYAPPVRKIRYFEKEMEERRQLLKMKSGNLRIASRQLLILGIAIAPRLGTRKEQSIKFWGDLLSDFQSSRPTRVRT